MKTTAEIHQEWREHVKYLRTLPCENVDPDTLAQVELAIRRCPYSSVSDAIMQINGGWLCGMKYDLCLAALLQAGCIEPVAFGVFRIDRRKLPQIEVQNPLADALTISVRPLPGKIVVPSSPPPPIQWGMFEDSERG